MVGPPPDSWEVEPTQASAREAAAGLWRLRLPSAWPGMGHVNAYVIARDDGIVLFDTGPGGDESCVRSLEHAIAQTGHALEDVRLLVVTHAHTDHMGIAPLVRRRSGAEVWAHPDDGHFQDALDDPEGIQDARARRARQEGVPEEQIEGFASLGEELDGSLGPIAPDRHLRAGMIVDTALGPWRALETPGHCPSHVSLVQDDAGIAIAADLICSVFVPWLDYGYSEDPVAQYLASLDAFAAEGEWRLALPGHGRPIDDVAGVVAMTRDGLLSGLDATRAAVAAGPAGAWDLSLRVYGEPAPEAAVPNFTTVVSFLRHLRLRGEVVRETDADGRFIHRAAT